MVPSRTLLVAAFVAYVTAAAVESGGGGGGVDVLPEGNDRKIFGGGNITINKVPWQALLYRDRIPICGGAIISGKWLLTAAHCVENHTMHSYEIRVGSVYKSWGGNVYAVRKVVMHRKFNTSTLLNDIAALKTTSPIKFGHDVKPATLPRMGSRRVPVGSMLQVSGWGLVSWEVGSDWLVATKIPLVDPKVCHKNLVFHEESQLCAGTSTMKACKGDSGGPLVWGDVLVGLVSYGQRRCVEPAAGFTDVIFYRGWIRRITGL